MVNLSPQYAAISEKTGRQTVLFVIPVFNDWASLATLLEHLDEQLKDEGVVGDVLCVNDGSSVPVTHLDNLSLSAIEAVNVLHLKRNLGHQKAIALGLVYAEVHYTADMIVVMDSDGEDRPEEAVRLIQTCISHDNEKLVFARRTQRSESWIFRVFYSIYRRTYRLLTGCDIRVGNFSVIPYPLLRRLVCVSEIWSHYAAGVLHAKLPCIDIATSRGYRYYGSSRMNFVALVAHGLSAISVHGEIIGVRLLVASFGLMALALAGLASIIGIRLLTDWAIPGWSSYLAVTFISIILQIVLMSVSFIFLVLVSRNNSTFLPHRDYKYFILSLGKVFSIR